MADESTAAATETAETTQATEQTAEAVSSPEAKQATTTLTDADEGKESKAAVAWPDDWRDRAAKGDEKRLAKLSRYASPEAALDALFAAQQKLSSGELKSAKPKGDSPEAIAEWRKENGIPEKPEEYAMPEGLIIGEQEKPLIDAFIKDMHGANAHPEVVKSAISSYYKMQEEQQAQRMELDEQQREEAVEALREEWGGKYKAYTNLIKGMLDSAPEGVGESIMHARAGDGTALLNNPQVMRWLLGMKLEIDPVATLVPSGANPTAAIEAEIGTLTKMMGDRSSDYWKGPNAEKNQARYRELVSAQSKMKK